MAWVLKAPDSGVDDSTTPRVLALRKLIAEAVRAANRKETEFAATDDEFGLVVRLICFGSEPHAVRVGRIFPPADPDVMLTGKQLGALVYGPAEADDLYDIPLKLE